MYLGRTDPISGQDLTSNALIPNVSLRACIRRFLLAAALMEAEAEAAASTGNTGHGGNGGAGEGAAGGASGAGAE